ncbi:alpha-soluble NSF attachment protein SEC17 [Lachancea thermotolerans CBS 6340]|uniref:KLTH0E01518p n=1 Tax=Lachancea thermotolerans (strain ATCC 56472 / CBS 6340 / NRRL Y-8284) TaxID=559295 RepID=C5DH57_LACTC|nr:KLTH0E01518p [Lachancea thermotolerans CBS 6340]CAR23118.1 KLTH0E01518p [Lachancea thermotolerans CBS 6340]
MSDPQALVQKARKKAQPSSGFFKLFGASDSYKFEEAADLFVEAANLYKLRRELEPAGELFLEAASCQIKAGNDDEAGNTYVEAFKAFKAGASPSKACDALNRAIEIFTRRGQFRRGANFKFELAEILESDLHDFPHAIDAYEAAADWYAQDQALALANKAYLKCADLKALDARYIEACDVYRKVIANSVGNKLSQWSLKDYYLKTALCYLAADDQVAARRTESEALAEDSNFAGSREHDLLAALLEACSEGDAEKLSAKVYEFDRFSKLDKWKTTILLKIKDTIATADDDLL